MTLSTPQIILDANETTTVTEDDIATTFRTELHAACAYYRGRSRFRECDWTPSGLCRNCGRRMPTMPQIVKRLEHDAALALPVVAKLTLLADEFEKLSIELIGHTGERNELIEYGARRSAAQLRCARQFVIDGKWTQAHAVIWLRAASLVLHGLGRSVTA